MLAEVVVAVLLSKAPILSLSLQYVRSPWVNASGGCVHFVVMAAGEESSELVAGAKSKQLVEVAR